MVTSRAGILAQIETDMLNENVSLASILQKCILLTGLAGSEKLREWARNELSGYNSDATPDYRRLPAGLYAQVTNRAGFNPITQRITGAELPKQIREYLSEQGIDVGVAVLGNGIGELEALANEGQEMYRLSPAWGNVMIETLNRFNAAPNSVVAAVYWPVAGTAIRGIIVNVRTALAELVADLIASTPSIQEIPDKSAATQAVHLVEAEPMGNGPKDGTSASVGNVSIGDGNTGNVINILQNSSARQSFEIRAYDKRRIQSWADDVERRAPSHGMDENDLNEVLKEIAELRAALEKDQPDGAKIQRIIKYVVRILKGTVGSLASSGLVEAGLDLLNN